MCIYFIQAEQGGLIKIGYAKNPSDRLYNLQMSCPILLKILATIKNVPQERESIVHYHLSEWRQYGEWFEPSIEVIDFMQKEAVIYEPKSIPIFDEEASIVRNGKQLKRCKGYSRVTGERCKNPTAWNTVDYCSVHKP
jgi:hypothetical protein